jgi:hypothetical protein
VNVFLRVPWGVKRFKAVACEQSESFEVQYATATSGARSRTNCLASFATDSAMRFAPTIATGM